jgi:hypothetical protein
MRRLIGESAGPVDDPQKSAVPAGNRAGCKLVEPRGEPWEAEMTYLMRNDGTGFVAGSLMAFLVVVGLFAITTAY